MRKYLPNLSRIFMLNIQLTDDAEKATAVLTMQQCTPPLSSTDRTSKIQQQRVVSPIHSTGESTSQ